MEKYVKLLYDRLSDKDKMKIFLIMDNAINEMHNNRIISQLPPELAAKVHDPDPKVRIAEKTVLAKSIGKSHIPVSQPMPLTEGGLAFVTVVSYEPKFVNSISICIQGGLEGLHQSGVSFDYKIIINDNGHDVSPLIKNIEVLKELYPEFNIAFKAAEKKPTPKNEGNVQQKNKEEQAKPIMDEKDVSKKKGFFARLFNK